MSSSAGPPPRYAPDEWFPRYTYVPGRAPHPLSDPQGHSFGHAPATTTAIDDSNWRTHREYLFAVDLFNYGYYWEAHEAWETVWHACGRIGPTADLLKGLIKLAAAGVKLREGQATGVERHARRAADLLAKAWSSPSAPRLGLPIEELLAGANAVTDQPPPRCDLPPSDVRPLLPCVLRLRF